MRLGLALGSGGARGWCHIGVLQELRDMGIAPDVVAGCSMGALVGAAWAADRLDALEDWARSLSLQKFLTYVDLRLAGGGLVQGAAIRDVLRDLDVPERFNALKRPLIVVATDMASGREVWIQDGDLFRAIRGSISIPGVFSPARKDGKWLLDGGVTNPVPCSACRALGADRTIAVNPNAKPGHDLWREKERSGGIWDFLDDPGLTKYLPDPVRSYLVDKKSEAMPPNYVDVVSTAIDIMTDFMRQARQAADPPHILLDADLMNTMTVLELHRAGEAIDEGRRMVRDRADDIREVVERAR
ncbi:patatin-like phospholipase family protein [Marimonas arenosa]|uniref:Patatin-like phospholipase family protein n=1 Tax=Marimonas arenosa TaxID=1795305 RepID=A0AAE3WA88_9RHOB|nr:patatin-like phospholipase family protein [Marimonas arenosa]MDQ2089034.1 patatin-like phospholipase family protein [Marimonas arenosa]